MVHPDDTSSTNQEATPTVNAVIRNTWAPLRDISQFRRYVSRVSVTIRTKGWSRQSTRRILYRVGAHFLNANEVFRPFTANGPCVPQQFCLNRSFLASLERQTGNLRGRQGLEYCDLSAVAQALGRAVGFFTNTGQLDCDMIRAGAPVNIVSSAIPQYPVSSTNCVFIPRHLDPETGEHVFAVLAAAVNSCNVSVVTDYIRIDSNNDVVFEQPMGPDCFQAVWTALKILLWMAKQCMAGQAIAVAFCSGLHDALDVVSHTTDGLIVGDILRAIKYAPPRGTICMDGWRDYNGLANFSPAPNMAEVATVVDSIALVTAAQSSRADPLVKLGAQFYPSIFVVNKPTPPGEEERKFLATAQLCNLVFRSQKWSAKYAELLAAALCVQGGEHLGSEALRSGVCNIQANGKGCIAFRSIAPWYWIEPTTLFEERSDDIPADKGGYGIICGMNCPTFMPFYEKVSKTYETDTHDLLRVRWCSARTTGIGVAGLGDDMGLVDIVPREMSEKSLVHVRGEGEILERMKSQSCLRDYLWTRGSCWLPAPAEMLYTAPYIGMVVYKRELDENGDEKRRTAFPVDEDGMDDESGVYLVALRPMNLTDGGAGMVHHEVNRNVTSAGLRLASLLLNPAQSRRPPFVSALMPITTELTPISEINGVEGTHFSQKERM